MVEVKALTFGDDALHTHHTAQQAGGEGARGHVLGAKAALQAHKELLVLLGIGGVHRCHQVLQRTLEGKELLEGVIHQPAEDQDMSEGPSV